MVVIDGTNLVLGRLASHVAKKALRGENVDVVNVENIVINGNRQNILEEYHENWVRSSRRNPIDGPKFPRHPEKLVKRTIRNMVGYKTARGRLALKRVKIHIGVPSELEKTNTITVEEAKSNPRRKNITIKELTSQLGYNYKKVN